MGYRSPEPLAPEHDLTAFDCGEPALDDWLRRHARASHTSGGARVFVTTLVEDTTRVVGYYALAAAQVEPSAAPRRLLKGQPQHRAALPSCLPGSPSTASTNAGILACRCYVTRCSVSCKPPTQSASVR